MSYLVKYGESVLFAPGDEELSIHDAKITQKSNGYSIFSFTMPPKHPLHGQLFLHALDKRITVWFDDTMLFCGIITSKVKTMWLEWEVICESELVLLSWVLTRYKPTNNLASTALAELMGIYNSHVWRLGRKYAITVDPESQASSVGYEDPYSENNICDAETSSPRPILDILTNNIVDAYGAFMRLRYDENGNKLIGIFPSAPETSAQIIQLGENLIDYTYTESDDEMYTACYPIGGTSGDILSYGETGWLVVDEAGEVGSNVFKLRAKSGSVNVIDGGIMIIGKDSLVCTTYKTVGETPVDVDVWPAIPYAIPAGKNVRYVGRRPNYYDGTVTLAGLPRQWFGNAYYCDRSLVYHDNAANRYGIKCMTYHDADIKDPYMLRNKAAAMLSQHVWPKRTVSVKAIDMAFYAEGYEHLQASQKVRVVSQAHGLDEDMYISQADLDLQDPGQTRYTLGSIESSVTKSLGKLNDKATTVTDNLLIEMNDSMTKSAGSLVKSGNKINLVSVNGKVLSSIDIS